MPQVFDKSSKWLLEHHGSALRSLQSDVVQPRHLPDRLLEVRLRGQSQMRLILVEIATYPEPRMVQRAADDLLLVYHTRGEMPELLAAGTGGIIASVPLTRFEGRPRDILQRCRDHINREASHQERGNLAVTQVLTKPRFPDTQLLTLFGGRQIMIDSPFYAVLGLGRPR